MVVTKDKYSRKLGESMMPWAAKPLTWSIFQPILSDAWARALVLASGVKITRSTLFVRQYGRVYVNATPVQAAWWAMGSSTALQSIENAPRFGLLPLQLGLSSDLVVRMSRSIAEVRESAEQKTATDDYRALTEESLMRRVEEVIIDLQESIHQDIVHVYVEHLTAIMHRQVAAKQLQTQWAFPSELSSLLLELGDRLTRMRLLASADSVYYLTIDEVRQIIAGGCATGTCNDYRLRTAMRKREWDEAEKAVAPDYVELDRSRTP
ncbi:MAG TPA: hypothetical protein VMB46_02750 [Methanomassiliicoccales archaeon]|nr:hypothetical protein [Methanomassiliicoccales archaeon]